MTMTMALLNIVAHRLNRCMHIPGRIKAIETHKSKTIKQQHIHYMTCQYFLARKKLDVGLLVVMI